MGLNNSSRVATVTGGLFADIGILDSSTENSFRFELTVLVSDMTQ